MNRSRCQVERCFYGGLLLSLLLHAVAVVYFLSADDSGAALAGTTISVCLVTKRNEQAGKQQTESATESHAVVAAGPKQTVPALQERSPAEPGKVVSSQPEQPNQKTCQRIVPIHHETIKKTVVVEPIGSLVQAGAVEQSAASEVAPVAVLSPDSGIPSEVAPVAHVLLASLKPEGIDVAGEIGLYRSSFGDAGGPQVLAMPRLQYPQRAKRLRKEGRVMLLLQLDNTGDLENASVLESAGYGFDEAALSAVARARFSPAERDGQAIACLASLPIRFRLQATR